MLPADWHRRRRGQTWRWHQQLLRITAIRQFVNTAARVVVVWTAINTIITRYCTWYEKCVAVNRSRQIVAVVVIIVIAAAWRMAAVIRRRQRTRDLEIRELKYLNVNYKKFSKMFIWYESGIYIYITNIYLYEYK